MLNQNEKWKNENRMVLIIAILAIGLILLPVSSKAQTMVDYQCFPVFTTSAVTPNILIILDNSGSMNFMAYGYDANGYYHPDDFDPNTIYYGYFDPTSQYSYASNEFDRDPGGSWNGNFLNWLSMRRVDVARKVLVGGLATSRTGGGNTKLIGETPVQESRKYFKFYDHSGNYTPYDDNHLYKLSKGKIEIYSIDTPANFDYNGDYKMYCNAYNGHDALCEDVVFWYNGNSNQDGQSYTIYPKSGGSGGCDYDLYNYGNPLTGLTYVTSYVIKVDKVEAEEPDVFLDGKIAGVIQRVGERARFGLEFFNNDGSKYETDWGKDGGYISSYIGGNLTSMVTSIENKGCDTWTPLAESFYEGVRYYRQDAPYYHNGNYSVNQNLDPFYYQDEGQYVECGKNFILLITDGESTMDLNIPAGYQDYDSDGNDPGSYDSSGSDYLDDVALWAHTNDMRTGAKDISDMQEITLYAVFAFGSGSQLLMDAAKNGGFIDRNGNDIPDIDEEWDEDSNGIPDNYLEAPNGNELEAKIIAAITAILQQAASGTAVSILSTSSEGEGSLYQAFFKPVVFDEMREINWVGYLNSLWVDPYGNLREDTVHDNALVYSEDKIVRFTVDEESGDTEAVRYHDADGDGKADSETPYETVPLSELDPQWEAGEKLALRDPSTRSIMTWVDIDGDGEYDDGPVDEFISFDTTNAATLRPFLDVATEAEAANIISFIRGESVTGYRDRNITIGANEYVWKLGDIVYSTPTVVGRPMEMYNQYYSDFTYGQFFTQWKHRGVTVYVGANDGMLHAFKAGTFNEGDNPVTDDGDPDTNDDVEHGWYSATEVPATTEALGEERWAYIPYNLLPHLKWLTRPDYSHVYYVDLKPKVTDVRIFSDDANHPNGWGTILIGGMRLGGGAYTFTEDFDNDPATPDEQRTFRSAYYALDITVPDVPVLLGEVTDPTGKMAFTTSYPAIARVETNVGFNNPEDDEWFFIVGSGPTECDGNSDQDGYIFVIDLDGGQIMKQFGPLDSNAFLANPITLDINLNYNVESIYIGETHDPSSDDDPANDLGKMHRITTRDTTQAALQYYTNPANWVRTDLLNVPNTPAITASATASTDEESTNFGAIDNGSDVIHGNIWIYFGTGRYYNTKDKADTDTSQYFYAVKDSCPYGDCAAADTVTSLDDLYPSTSVVVLNDKTVIVGATPKSWDAFVNEVQAKDGWYIDLAAGGERQLNRPSILGGVVLFAPFTPESDICGFGGSGSLYALYYETGTTYYKDILGTVDYPGDKKECIKRISLDKGITSEIGLHVGQKAESTGFIQQGTGSVTQVDVDLAFYIKSRIIGWMQQ